MLDEIKDSIKRRHDEINRRILLNSIALQKRILNGSYQHRPYVPPVASKLYHLHERWLFGTEKEKSLLDLPFQNILFDRYDEANQLRLMKYMTRVRQNASVRMLEDEGFASLFLNTEEFDAVVFSCDIRRSTELMLKCESPEIYAEFINALTSELTEAVKYNYGIYDKFTGDGLLAFFPDFYSGRDSLLYAVKCAAECNTVFEAVFGAYRDKFDIGSMQTGLGVGIDCGKVFKAGEELEYTVVGRPVVYACRFSSCPAGHIYLTERAEELLEKSPLAAGLGPQKTLIPIKHEADMCAYDIPLADTQLFESLKPELPDWAV